MNKGVKRYKGVKGDTGGSIRPVSTNWGIM